MAMNLKIVFVALSILLLIAACAPKEAPPAPTEPAVPTEPTPAPTPEVTPPAPAQDNAVSDVEVQTQQIEEISNDFDTSAIDDLDKELAEIDKLDLG